MIWLQSHASKALRLFFILKLIEFGRLEKYTQITNIFIGLMSISNTMYFPGTGINHECNKVCKKVLNGGSAAAGKLAKKQVVGTLELCDHHPSHHEKLYRGLW